MSSGSPPRRSHRMREITIAADTANTYAIPYACRNSGPIWKPFSDGLGMKAGIGHHDNPGSSRGSTSRPPPGRQRRDGRARAGRRPVGISRHGRVERRAQAGSQILGGEPRVELPSELERRVCAACRGRREHAPVGERLERRDPVVLAAGRTHEHPRAAQHRAVVGRRETARRLHPLACLRNRSVPATTSVSPGRRAADQASSTIDSRRLTGSAPYVIAAMSRSAAGGPDRSTGTGTIGPPSERRGSIARSLMRMISGEAAIRRGSRSAAIRRAGPAGSPPRSRRARSPRGGATAALR